MARIRYEDVRDFCKKNGINWKSLDPDKKEMVTAGTQLGTLEDADILKICNPKTSLIGASAVMARAREKAWSE